MSTKHSPLPWKVGGPRQANELGDELTITDDGACVIVCAVWPVGEDFDCANCDGPKQRANAELIVKAVNHHEELVRMLTGCADVLEGAEKTLPGPDADLVRRSMLRQARAARALLAKLEAKP